MLDDESEYHPRAENFKPAVELTDSAAKESINIWNEYTMWYRGGRNEEYDPTEVKI